MHGFIPERKHPVTTAITSTPTFIGLDGVSMEIDMASTVEHRLGALDGYDDLSILGRFTGENHFNP